MTTALRRSWDLARHHVEQNGGVIDRTGLGKLWCVGRARVKEYVDMPDFPPPLPGCGLNCKEVWLKNEVEAWKRDREERFR